MSIFNQIKQKEILLTEILHESCDLMDEDRIHLFFLKDIKPEKYREEAKRKPFYIIENNILTHYSIYGEIGEPLDHKNFYDIYSFIFSLIYPKINSKYVKMAALLVYEPDKCQIDNLKQYIQIASPKNKIEEISLISNISNYLTSICLRKLLNVFTRNKCKLINSKVFGIPPFSKTDLIKTIQGEWKNTYYYRDKDGISAKIESYEFTKTQIIIRTFPNGQEKAERLNFYVVFYSGNTLWLSIKQENSLEYDLIISLNHEKNFAIIRNGSNQKTITRID